jgi:hypothetical protein
MFSLRIVLALKETALATATALNVCGITKKKMKIHIVHGSFDGYVLSC